MLRSAEQLRGYTILATDGEIGRVDAFLFDMATWTVRYLAVRTGSWLMGRVVLVPPEVLSGIDPEARTLHVALTCTQVRHSPEVDTEHPDLPPQGIGLARYYGHSSYWGAPGVWSAGTYPETLGGGAEPRPQQRSEEEEHGAERLRSTRQVTGHRIRARDGEIGHVADFIVDEASWAIRYMVVDTGTWWPGRRVLVSPEWIRNVSWASALVAVDLEREVIRQGPEYDPSRLLNREDEEALYRHHQRRGYWEDHK